jgi:hypothetical protein
VSGAASAVAPPRSCAFPLYGEAFSRGDIECVLIASRIHYSASKPGALTND